MLRIGIASRRRLEAPLRAALAAKATRPLRAVDESTARASEEEGSSRQPIRTSRATIHIAQFPPDEIPSHTYDILIADPDYLAGSLGRLPPECVWVQGTWAGVDKLIKAVATQGMTPQWTLTRCAGQFGVSMSEYILGVILSKERNIARYWDDQKIHAWRSQGLETHFYRTLGELSACVVGVGEIGQAICRSLLFHGVSVRGVARSLPDETKAIPGVDYFLVDDIVEAASDVDYAIFVLPSTDATRGLITKKFMQQGRFSKTTFINIGRGDLAASDEVWCECLDAGLLQHAILDVFNDEPLPKDSALWDHPNITITPHFSGFSYSKGIIAHFVQNLELFLASTTSEGEGEGEGEGTADWSGVRDVWPKVDFSQSY